MTPPADVLALIPARGGSKGIPGKNLLPILGKPLIAYSILQALQSRWITRVVVSTDDEAIAEVARQWGADTPFMRPAALAHDLSPDIDAFRHALDWLAFNEGTTPELVVHLRATGPLRRVETIDAAIERLRLHPEADSLRSVSEPHHSPFKMWRIERGLLEPLLQVEGMPEAHSMPRQLLPEVFWQNGYVDVIRPATIWGGSMSGRTVLPFVVTEPIHELDYPEDIPALEEALRRHEQGLDPAPEPRRRPV